MKPTKRKIEAVVPVEEQKRTAAQKFIDDVNAFVVADEQTHVTAIIKLGEIKNAVKSAEAERDLLLKPAKETVRAIKNKWKPVELLLDQADKILRGKVNAYVTATEEKAKQNLNKLDQKIESGSISRPETIQKKTEEIKNTLAPSVIATGTATAQNKKVAKLSIDDKNLIPDEFWILDEVALRKAVVVEKREVPGASIKYENSVAIF